MGINGVWSIGRRNQSGWIRLERWLVTLPPSVRGVEGLHLPPTFVNTNRLPRDEPQETWRNTLGVVGQIWFQRTVSCFESCFRSRNCRSRITISKPFFTPTWSRNRWRKYHSKNKINPTVDSTKSPSFFQHLWFTALTTTHHSLCQYVAVYRVDLWK